MNGFTPLGETDKDTKIVNDSFYSEIDPNDFRNLMRLDSAITNPRVRQALITAMINVNNELASWQQNQRDQGHQDLSQVPATKIDNKTVFEHDYHRAVYCLAKADLSERYQDYDSSASGTEKAEEMQESIDDYRRQSQIAIRRILGEPQTTIDLI